ncbi:hypothetical protein [Alcaligenes phenolicus]|uniref:Uncharacterized protein n=1 Tax=Alcaligenes phenolicus TaxID=232846 RepID=A0ABV2BI15_9BURK
MNSHSDFVFESRFSNNSVIVLDALRSSDMQTARRLEEALFPLKHEDGTAYCRIIKTPDRQSFISTLQSIEEECRLGLKPILHIEAHGDKVAGLEIGDQQEVVIWQELENELTKINKSTGNNLGVVLATCWGLYAISPLKIYNPSPYFFLIGPDKIVSAGYIDDQMKEFYKTLFNSSSLDAAMVKVAQEFKQYHSEQFFCHVFATYLRNGCMGKGAASRVERLLSEAIERGASNNRETRRKFRRSTRSSVKPSKETFTRHAHLFLHGKVPVSYESLLQFVQKSAA